APHRGVIKRREVFVPKDFSAVTGQVRVERVAAHEVQVHRVGFEQPALRSTPTQHPAPPADCLDATGASSFPVVSVASHGRLFGRVPRFSSWTVRTPWSLAFASIIRVSSAKSLSDGSAPGPGVGSTAYTRNAGPISAAIV